MESFKEEFFKSIDPVVSSILNKALEDKTVGVSDCYELFKTKGADFKALVMVADWIRYKRVGNIVTFVYNRNINYTNICYMGCGFCAYSRRKEDPEGFLLSPDEIAAKANEAWEIGATEVCIQGGLHPEVDVYYYEKILKAIRGKTPIHIHAFSPMEIAYAGSKKNLSPKETLMMLKEAGLNSIPGTAAEILDDEVRSKICPQKITTSEWIEVVKIAHKLGIPTTATIMHGHIETAEHWIKHLSIIKEIQKETKGFTEFIPLTFMHWKAPSYLEGKTRPGATGVEDIKMYAVPRIMFNGLINNIQVSWVKLGAKLAQLALNAGANDFGGTLIEENISKAAGGASGQYLPIQEIVRHIKDLGRIPAQRTTQYEILKINNF